MRWLTWMDNLNLIEALSFYLALCFIVSTAIRVRVYRSVLGMILASPKRWPKLLQLANTHRTVFLAWPMLLTIALSFLVMIGNILAYRLVLIDARVSFQDLRGHWLPLAAALFSGGLMV